MQAQLIGKTVDECILRILERIKKNKDPCILDVSVCLTNPAARFSLMPLINPAVGVIYGICALAGVNDDDVLKNDYMPEKTTKAFVKTMQGPLLRGYKAGLKTSVSLRTAAGSIGSNQTAGRIDQLSNAVEFLKTEHQAKIILHDPALKPDGKQELPCMPSMLNLFIENDCLSMDVYIDGMDISGFACYVAPVFTFIQQIIAMLLNVPLGNFTVKAESLFLNFETSEIEIDEMLDFVRSFKRMTVVDKDLYVENQAYDLRFIDNALRYLGDFANRVKEGDILVANPFPEGRHLRLFYDCAEALRAAEAVKQKLEIEGESVFYHPHLANYYNISSCKNI